MGLVYHKEERKAARENSTVRIAQRFNAGSAGINQ
jgi:hypothetical protein